MNRLHNEFRRVFGSINVDENTGAIGAEGWPELVKYVPDVAARILSGFPDGIATTEAGDAKVCSALELGGAVDDGVNYNYRTVRFPARRFEDHDDSLKACADAYVAEHPEARGYHMDARWEDEDRDVILLDVPA
jgi:hypothetical protein